MTSVTTNRMIPTHVSIIMDGNGRWAQQRHLPRTFGHKEGAESVRACLEAAIETGVKYLSLYTFSEENWNRPQAEVSGINSLFVTVMARERKNLKDNGVRFLVIGNRSRLSADLLHDIEELEAYTADCRTLTLMVMFSYSGKWDIVQAVNRYREDIAAGKVDASGQIDIAGYEKYLSTAGFPDPDLLIRTGGELRISNYMLWQCAYSEFYFTDVLWPDFRKTEFRKALDSFENRQRRYGEIN
ncbi:MAG: di-trans,poly-cis-decaprenylcistransferase [Bacteroidales bacterium]|nr:di-trans,poly-cis-decaprenylcistransferase [Bacteroidales bacterium]